MPQRYDDRGRGYSRPPQYHPPRRDAQSGGRPRGGYNGYGSRGGYSGYDRYSRPAPRQGYRSYPQDREELRERRYGRRGISGWLVLTIVLLIAAMAAVSVALLRVSSLLGNIDYTTRAAVSESAFDVSASDVLGSLTDEGTPGEPLNEYQTSVYRREIFNAYFPEREHFHGESATNILILCDAGENTASDILALITVNSAKSEVTFTALMPETGIAYADMDKPLRLSCAARLGGVPLAIDTVQSLFGVKIDKFLHINNQGFADIVDALGGVRVNLSAEECAVLNNRLEAYLGAGNPVNAGENVLSGMQMLVCARCASAVGDGRTASRRTVLMYGMAETLHNAGVSELMRAFAALSEHCSTDLTREQIIAMATSIKEMKDYAIKVDAVPADGEYSLVGIDGVSVMRLGDPSSMRKRLVSAADAGYGIPHETGDQ